MRRATLILPLVGAAAMFFALRARASNLEEGDDINIAKDFTAASSDQPSDYVYGVNMSPEQNMLAFLALIRRFEVGGDHYNILYGGGTFASYADHPNIRVPIGLAGYEGKYSTAAGAYQFLWKTWDNLRNRLALADFTPASQDAAAVGLLDEIGATPYISNGDFDQALRIASSQWASLPYSGANQHPKSIAAANEFLQDYLGRFA